MEFFRQRNTGTADLFTIFGTKRELDELENSNQLISAENYCNRHRTKDDILIVECFWYKNQLAKELAEVAKPLDQYEYYQKLKKEGGFGEL